MPALALCLFCLTPAHAQNQTETQAQVATPPATPQGPDAKPAPDTALICIDQDPGSASRLTPRRACHTQAEWNKLQAKSR